MDEPKHVDESELVGIPAGWPEKFPLGRDPSLSDRQAITFFDRASKSAIINWQHERAAQLIRHVRLSPPWWREHLATVSEGGAWRDVNMEDWAEARRPGPRVCPCTFMRVSCRSG